MRRSESDTADELLAFLFDGQPHVLTPPMRDWLIASRRFKTFVTSFRDKIRKKLRVTQDHETLHDLRLELETAYLLLQEKAFAVEYEPGNSRPVRSPDFAVHYTTSLTFMVEVTRLRAVSAASFEERLMDAISSKLGQLLPGRSNILIVGVDALAITGSDLQTVMLRLQQRAERSDAALWQRYGFRERAQFFQHYQRLSEILVRSTQVVSGRPAIAWSNPQARHPLSGKARTALYRSHGLV